MVKIIVAVVVLVVLGVVAFFVFRESPDVEQ